MSSYTLTQLTSHSETSSASAILHGIGQDQKNTSSTSTVLEAGRASAYDNLIKISR